MLLPVYGLLFAGLTVICLPLALMNVTDTKNVRLSELRPGIRATIKSHEESDFQLTLMEMGCIPGEPVLVEMIAPLGDPMAIQIAGYYLSIRKQDADKIWVGIS